MNEVNNDVPVSNPSNIQSSSATIGSKTFYILLAILVLAPLAFLPTSYVALDAVKMTFISIGALIVALLYIVSSYRERTLLIPPKGVVWSGIAVATSLVVSSFVGGQVGKSFFGQGFEINTASFLLTMLLFGIAVFGIIKRKPERTVVVLVGITASFLILVLFHALRFMIGPTFLSLSVLTSTVSTLLGSWNDLALYGVIVSLVALSALVFLPLSKKMKMVYSVLLLISLFVVYVINSTPVWFIASIVLFGFAIYQSISISRAQGSIVPFLKRFAWLPLLVACIAGLLTWKGIPLAKPAITAIGAQYTTFSLPWQLSLDVAAGAIKQSPLFGLGPNRFSQAYISYKPLIINSTNAWSTEFNYAFGLLPTFIVTQGLLGILAWMLLIIFVGIYFVRMIRNLPQDPQARFIVISLSMIATFLWGVSMLMVPSHTLVLYAAFATAAALGAGTGYGLLKSYIPSSRMATRISTPIVIGAVVICVVWIVWYGKGAVSLAYFGSGAQALSVRSDTEAADKAFASAYFFNPSDVYLQARAETGLVKANQIASSITQNMPASTSQALVGQVVDTINETIKYSEQAIEFDPTNYYNYLSVARVSELAANVRMDKAYDNAVAAYTRAIQINPLNPSLYLNLARLQTSQNKLDDALRTLGATLQVKNDYLDAIFLLSQVSAAQGNLKDAIIAATVASQINPQNAVIFFQLGLLQYNNKDYAASAKALENAVTLQSDYANAKYFLGLSYVRLGMIEEAINQFAKLAETNPDNEEINFILNNLNAGKSPFADAQPPVTPNPEKRSSLPIKQNQ